MNYRHYLDTSINQDHKIDLISPGLSMKKTLTTLDTLEENDGYVPTRSKDYVWRDEVDDDFFPALACILVDDDEIVKKVMDVDQFYLFSIFKKQIAISEYSSIRDELKSSVHFYQHSSIHILQKAWECITSGGDSFGHSELICKSKTADLVYGRTFVCVGAFDDLYIFYLNSKDYKDHDSIFSWKCRAKQINIKPDMYESLMTLITMHYEARTIISERCLEAFFRINFRDKFPEDYDD